MIKYKQAIPYDSFKSAVKDLPRNKLAGTLVKIQDYNPSDHTLKIVNAETGEPLVPNVDINAEVVRSKGFEQPNSKSIKALAAPDAPIMEVSDSDASIRGSSNNGFFSTRESGNIVKGPISFSAQPHEIRVSGMMTLHPLLLSGFPSTIVTPIPVLQWSLPSAEMLGPIAKDIALIGTLLGAI